MMSSKGDVLLSLGPHGQKLRRKKKRRRRGLMQIEGMVHGACPHIIDYSVLCNGTASFY